MRLEMLDKKFPTLPKEYAPFLTYFLRISDITRWDRLYTSCSTVLIKNSSTKIWQSICENTPKKK